MSESLTFAHFLFFGEQCEWIVHFAQIKWAMWANRWGRSPKMSNHARFDSLRSLRGNERSWANHSGRSPKKRKWANRSGLLICLERPERFAHGFISSERPERFANGSSFVLCDLSKSLTVAHLIWANEQMSDEQMSEFPALTARSWTPRRLTLRGVDNLIFRRSKSD